MSRALQEVFADSPELCAALRAPRVLVVEHPDLHAPAMPPDGTARAHAPVVLPGGVKASWTSVENILTQMLGEFVTQMDVVKALEAEVLSCQPVYENASDLKERFRR
jgi:hypothetical protein